MKRIFTLLAIVAFACVGKLSAQNVQLHYDFGGKWYDARKQLPSLNSTVEGLSFDRYGQTFYFVDMFYSQDGIDQAYWEIARDLKFWQAPIALHLEYNGGVDPRFRINNAYLAGLSYLWANNDGSKSFSVYAAYRHDQRKDRPHNMQLTGVWSYTTWNRVFTFNGFADLYTASVPNAKSNVIFMAEPQFWINCNQFVGIPDALNMSIGTEVRMHYNFMANDKFMIMPTLAVKWNFR